MEHGPQALRLAPHHGRDPRQTRQLLRHHHRKRISWRFSL